MSTTELNNQLTYINSRIRALGEDRIAINAKIEAFMDMRDNVELEIAKIELKTNPVKA